MKKRFRILYIGELREGGTCLDRMRTLEQTGHNVVSLDTTPWVGGGWRLFRSLAHRANAGPPVWGLNKAVVSICERVESADLVWVDRGRWIYPDTLAYLKMRTGARLLHYTPDPQLLHHKSRYFDACIPLYDVTVTTKHYEVEQYRARGARRVLLVLQGYGDRFAPRAASQRDRATFGSDVCFVGHCERHYAQRLQAASQVAERLRVWGLGWCRHARFHAWARTHVSGDGIWGESYPRALACTKIALGLLSKRVPETTTTRTFEIPATGVFMLAERTEDHLSLFKEGVEAEYFDSDEELQDKIRFYLAHDSAREKIAAAGRERCIRSGYHARSQLEKVMAQFVS